jgi:hypothetical protein
MHTSGPARLVVAPFFRASVTIGAGERALFARTLDAPSFEEAMRGRHEILRQNLRRLFAAARLAEVRGGDLVLAEGWRSNAIVRAGRPTRFVTGSWLSAVFLRLLRRRRLVGDGLRVRRRDVSRCTWEEARAIREIAAGTDMVGVSDAPCPSAARARRYLRGGRVMTPAEVWKETSGRGASDAHGLWAALQPTRSEALRASLVEAPNWVLHGLSEVVTRSTGLVPPLEVRLARALRPDHSARAISSTASGFSTDARSPTGSPR